MYKTFSFINIVLGLTILVFVAWLVDIWYHPKHPDKVDGDQVVALDKKFMAPGSLRQAYSPEVIEEVSQNNLFRKERKEYVKPPPPPPAPPAAPPPPPPKPKVPPPKLKVNGIMLLGTKKIAVLEGEYSIFKGERDFEKKKLKKKGYKVGSQIGTYFITDVNRKTVTLDDREGSIVKVSLEPREEKFQIKRDGNHFYHKGKRPSPAEIKKASNANKNQANQAKRPPPARVSGRRTVPEAERRLSVIDRISGNKNRRAAVSGAGTSGSHISGR